jgi:hypothetical protein
MSDHINLSIYSAAALRGCADPEGSSDEEYWAAYRAGLVNRFIKKDTAAHTALGERVFAAIRVRRAMDEDRSKPPEVFSWDRGYETPEAAIAAAWLVVDRLRAEGWLDAAAQLDRDADRTLADAQHSRCRNPVSVGVLRTAATRLRDAVERGEYPKAPPPESETQRE